jgi:hypothetical protein
MGRCLIKFEWKFTFSQRRKENPGNVYEISENYRKRQRSDKVRNYIFVKEVVSSTFLIHLQEKNLQWLGDVIRAGRDRVERGNELKFIG